MGYPTVESLSVIEKTKTFLNAEDRVRVLRNLVGLLTDEDMALLTGVTLYTLQFWRVHNTGPKFVKLGKKVFYRLIDVEEWITSCVLSGTSIPDEDPD